MADTFGIPTLFPPTHIQDETIRLALIDLSRQTEFWLRRIADRVDEQHGNRGTPSFAKNVDIAGNRLTNLGLPDADTDAQRVDRCLHLAADGASWDARNLPIRSLLEAVNLDESVSLQQLLERVAEAGAINAPPEVEDAGAVGAVRERFALEDHTHSGVNLGDAQTITGTKTFDLDPGAPFAVTASSAVVANLDADLIDGIQGAELLQRDGSVALTANWDAGSFEIRAETFESDVATGTAPLTIASTTVVTNLNADTVDGIQGADIIQRDGSVAMTGAFDMGGQNLNNVGSNSAEILSGTVDPSAGAGIAATIGSIYMRDNAGTGELWAKTAAADTSWTQITIP